MSDQLITALVAVLTGLIGLAALAVIFSPNATTSKVLTAGSAGFAADLRAAVSPVSGGGFGGMSLPSLGSGIG